MMNYQHLKIEFPALSDEAAASLHKFINALMLAVDEHFYLQLHRYYANKLDDMLIDSELIEEKLDNPPF
jgi:hypothetical protein